MVDSRYPSFGRFILFHLWLLSKPDYLRLGDLPPARGVCAGEHVDASGSNESESKLGSVEFTRSIISDRSTDLFSLSLSFSLSKLVSPAFSVQFLSRTSPSFSWIFGWIRVYLRLEEDHRTLNGHERREWRRLDARDGNGCWLLAFGVTFSNGSRGKSSFQNGFKKLTRNLCIWMATLKINGCLLWINPVCQSPLMTSAIFVVILQLARNFQEHLLLRIGTTWRNGTNGCYIITIRCNKKVSTTKVRDMSQCHTTYFHYDLWILMFLIYFDSQSWFMIFIPLRLLFSTSSQSRCDQWGPPWVLPVPSVAPSRAAVWRSVWCASCCRMRKAVSNLGNWV